MRLKRSLALVAALGLIAAACGDDNGGDDAGPATAAPSDDTTAEGDDEPVATDAPSDTEAPPADTEAPPADTEPAAPTEDLGSVTIVIGTDKTFEFLPAEYGLELGLWDERGLEVSNLYVQGSGQVAQTLAAGEGDIAVTAGASGVTPIISGLEARIIGEIGRDFNMMVMVVDADSEIESIDDMQGKTVGITSQGSLTDFLARLVRESQGWSEGDMDIAPIGGFNEQVAALESGAIDAFVWSAEAGFQLEESGDGRVVFDYGDLVENNVFEVINARTDVIENRPDAVRAYLEGWYETVQYMKDNPDETVAFCVEQYELSEFVCQSTYDLDIDNLSTDGVIPDPNLQGLAESVVSDAIPEPPSIDAFFDDRFLPIDP